MNNTIVSNAGNGIILRVYNYVIDSVFEITDNTIRSNRGDGLHITWSGFPPMPITRNNIAYNTGAGIYMAIPGTTYGNATPLITQNYIARNAYGILVYRYEFSSDVPEGIPTIFFNDIHSNINYDLKVLNTGQRRYNATYNYWGTLSANEISQKYMTSMMTSVWKKLNIHRFLTCRLGLRVRIFNRLYNRVFNSERHRRSRRTTLRLQL
ncbi:MAG: NosD domain-containing protein [Candidatus Bathyarchaeia archaeon]